MSSTWQIICCKRFQESLVMRFQSIPCETNPLTEFRYLIVVACTKRWPVSGRK